MSFDFQHLGPFVVGAPIGEGGMSQVFRGGHRATGERVALKVTRFGKNDGWRSRAFASEIATMARVYHRGIVSIHDWGTLPDRSGSWCAMDLAEQGALRGSHVRSWPQLRELLGQVLEALAHAHARDIVHRDLKPQNILVFGESTRPEYRLADFGLAYSRNPSDDTRVMGVTAGTPAYMAPEQLHGLWREYGPWTDLYALGCVAWEFATGDLPFQGKTPIEIALAHLRNDPPDFVPRFAVPAGFEAWVRRLIGRDWVRRPSSAVSARLELEALGAPVGGAAAVDEISAEAETMLLDLTELTHTLLDVGLTPEVTLAIAAAAPPTPDLTFPDDWRAARGAEARFGDTGSRLFGLRQTDFVGHEPERDEMWRRLRRVVDGDGPQVVVLESRQQSERRMLADWFVARARELAAVPRVLVDLGLRRQGLDPFREALEHLLVSWGLKGDRLVEHLRRVLPRLVGASDEALVQQLQTHLTADPRDGEARIASRGMFWRLLVRMAERAPLVLSLNAMERDADAWFMVERILLESRRVFVLVVTGEDQFPTASERWVDTQAATARLTLPPLSRAEAGTLVDRYMRLVPELRETWIDLAVHDIEFAMDSLRHGIAGGVLEPTPEGYRLRDGVTVSQTPARLAAVRLNVLGTAGADLPRVACLGATLGVSVGYAEWEALLSRAGLTLGGGALEELLRHSFVREERGRYVFESSKIRRLLLGHLGADDRAMVMEACGDDAEGVARAVDVLLAAGELEAAADRAVSVLELPQRNYANLGSWVPVGRRVQRALGHDHVRLRHALDYVEQYTRVIDGAGSAERLAELLAASELPPTDPLVLELRALQGIAFAYKGRMDDALDRTIAVLRDAPESELRLRAEVLSTRGWLEGVGRRFDDARTTYEEALTLAERTQDQGLISQIELYRGLLEASSRDAHAAANWFQLARAHAAEAADLDRLPRVWLDSGLGFLAVGEVDRALADTVAMWEGGIWSIPSQRGTVGWNYALALAFKGRFVEAHDIVAQTYAMLRPEQRTANPLGRSFEAVIAALERDTQTWDTLVAQGPSHVGFGVFARFAEDAWARHGDELRRAQAADFLRRPQ